MPHLINQVAMATGGSRGIVAATDTNVADAASAMVRAITIQTDIKDATINELDPIIDLNLCRTFKATHATLKHLNDSGRIIIASRAGPEASCVSGANPTANAGPMVKTGENSSVAGRSS